MNPADLRYSKDHEWVRSDGDTVTIGITQFAVESLGDVVYVDLPEKGATLKQFEKMGEIESVKAVSDLFSPVSGEIIERNLLLTEQPEAINGSPYDNGWMLKVYLSDVSELDSLLSQEQYEGMLASEGTK